MPASAASASAVIVMWSTNVVTDVTDNRVKRKSKATASKYCGNSNNNNNNSVLKTTDERDIYGLRSPHPLLGSLTPLSLLLHPLLLFTSSSTCFQFLRF